MISWRNDGTCGWGISSGSGSRPIQRRLLFPWAAARSFSWNIEAGLLSAAARADGTPRPENQLPFVGAGLVGIISETRDARQERFHDADRCRPAARPALLPRALRLRRRRRPTGGVPHRHVAPAGGR